MNDNYRSSAVVIGGGFYGTSIAKHLSKKHKLDVTLIEKSKNLLTRASFNNQARVHSGCHYPRDLKTATRSKLNYNRFINEWDESVESSFLNLYAIAKRQSKISSNYFLNFFKAINQPLKKAPESLQKLFNPRLIDSVFIIEESCFDARKIANRIEMDLGENNIKVVFNAEATNISRIDHMNVVTVKQDGNEAVFNADYVFNCTYAAIKELSKLSTELTNELTEICLVDVPLPFQSMGITVMDGPFFSLMPFPSRQLHSFSHVTYTPHNVWRVKENENQDSYLRGHNLNTNFLKMRSDAARYVSQLSGLKLVDSLVDIKSVLTANDGDDGRPILLEEDQRYKHVYSVLGAKIDNIYDALDSINTLIPCH